MGKWQFIQVKWRQKIYQCCKETKLSLLLRSYSMYVTCILHIHIFTGQHYTVHYIMGAKKWQLWEKQHLFSLSFFLTDQEHLNCVFSFLTLQPISTASFTYHYLIQINIGRKPCISAFQRKNITCLSILKYFGVF